MTFGPWSHIPESASLLRLRTSRNKSPQFPEEPRALVLSPQHKDAAWEEGRGYFSEIPRKTGMQGLWTVLSSALCEIGGRPGKKPVLDSAFHPPCVCNLLFSTRISPGSRPCVDMWKVLAGKGVLWDILFQLTKSLLNNQSLKKFKQKNNDCS